MSFLLLFVCFFFSSLETYLFIHLAKRVTCAQKSLTLDRVFYFSTELFMNLALRYSNWVLIDQCERCVSMSLFIALSREMMLKGVHNFTLASITFSFGFFSLSLSSMRTVACLVYSLLCCCCHCYCSSTVSHRRIDLSICVCDCIMEAWTWVFVDF